jgi:hypothetical protein
MLARLLKTFKRIFLPENLGDDGPRSMTAVQALTAVYRQLTQLAAQIEAHADGAPYPHVAERLRQIASEKHASAAQVKEWLEKQGAWVGQVSLSPVPAPNHWQRMMRALNDQRALEDFLLLQEPRLGAESQELAELMRLLKASQRVHRDALAQLAALADPQATQT